MGLRTRGSNAGGRRVRQLQPLVVAHHDAVFVGQQCTDQCGQLLVRDAEHVA